MLFLNSAVIMFLQMICYFIKTNRNDDNASEKPKPAPKKLNINWSARTQERATERGDNEQPVSNISDFYC